MSECVATKDELLSAEQAERLEAEGFLSIDDLTDQADVEFIRSLLLPLLEREDLAQVTTVRHMRKGDDAPPQPTREILGVLELEPRLKQSRYYRRAMAISKAVWGPKARLSFDHVIEKPPFSGDETAWHQDCAYSGPVSISMRRLHWWLPLQEATEANGCMSYVPGSHLGRRRRHEPVEVDGHFLRTEAPPPEDVVVCPLKVGGATVHLPHTLHYSGPNRSPAPRIAWILQIGVRGGIPQLV